MTRKVAVLVGSLRQGSFSRLAADALERLAPAGLSLEQVPIGHLGFYNQDLDSNPPAEWVEFRERIGSADAVLFVTPEYNRSVPAVLKNAVDIGSRPYGQGALSGKPAAVASVSPSALGGFGANQHLRQSLAVLDMAVMGQPEAYWGGAHTFFGEDGELVNAATEKVMKGFIDAFAAFLDKQLGSRPLRAAA
jgi:chromate reductase